MSDSAASRLAPAPTTAMFKISGLAYLTVLVTVMLIVMMIGVSPAWWSWTVILPIVQVWWITRVRTEADENGLRAMHLFRTNAISWDEIAGLRFPKWTTTCAVRPDGTTVRLPAVTFADLPVISAVSGGRVPDPYAAAERAELEAQLAADSDDDTA